MQFYKYYSTGRRIHTGVFKAQALMRSGIGSVLGREAERKTTEGENRSEC